jgi:hypothetical protein
MSRTSHRIASLSATVYRISPKAFSARARVGFAGEYVPVREVVDWDRQESQDILVCCVISIYCGRVDVLIQIFVLSLIGHLDDRARNKFHLWRAQISLQQLVGRGFVKCGQTSR